MLPIADVTCSCAVSQVVILPIYIMVCVRLTLWAQAVVEQQLGCPMLRYLSETTDEERLHVKRGTIDLLECHLKMRFVAPGDWIRIKV